jgi:hypothetical protein
MTTNSCSKEEVKSKKEKVRRERFPTGVRRPVSPLTLSLLTFALLLFFWPAVGQGQSSYRRDRTDRSRRDVATGQDPARSKSGRPEISGRPEASKSQTAGGATATPAGRITGPTEPNVTAKSADRRSSRPVEKPQVPSAGQDAQWAKYEVILQRNMFSRQRVPIRLKEAVKEAPRAMPNPESYFLLKGVVQENSQFIAFVEDKQTGSVLRLRQGDRVARGTIKSLNLDGVEYQLADKTTAVSMGFDLEGRHGAVTAGDLAGYTPMAAPAASGATTSPQAAPAADEAAILQRLMEQRKQQLGQ